MGRLLTGSLAGAALAAAVVGSAATASPVDRQDAEASALPGKVWILATLAGKAPLRGTVLTSTFTEQTVLRVALPAAGSGEPSVEHVSVLRVTVDAKGVTYLDNRAASLQDLRARLATLGDPSRARVLVAADRAASHGSVVQVLDLVRRAGIVRVSIETSPLTTAPPSGSS